MRRLILFCALFVMLRASVRSQERSALRSGDPLLLAGMRLEELIGRFGPPQAVYAVRGNEEWQDDVVFVYSEGDFYIAKDRVWQIGLKSVYGLSLGDPKAAALLTLGEEARDQGDHALRLFAGGPWPLTLRVNFSNTGLVSAIFLYRSDY